MYFSQFPKIYYDFPKDGSNTTLQILTDITTNVRVRKEVLENITLYDEYDILEGETPEMIAEKIYGNPELHWVIMLVNQRYDYLKDFPMSSDELNKYIEDTYGENGYNEIHHYEKDGIQTEAIAVMKIPLSVIPELRVNDFIALQPKANSKIISLSYEYNTTNAVNAQKLVMNSVVRVYDTTLDERTESSYIGNATVFSYSNNKIILGNLKLINNKAPNQIRSIYAEDSFSADLTNNVSGYGHVAVMVDYGRYSVGDLVTVMGVRYDETSQKNIYQQIINYQIPNGGFEVNSDYSIVTNYDYEFKINEEKRRIKIISPNLINQIIDEFKKIVTA